MVEHLHNQVGAKTLFATHYHELTELAARLPRLKNYNVAVREWHDQIVFLRKIVEGGTDKSYGIQVARLAGVPKGVLERAKEILRNLEESELTPEGNVRQATRRQQDRDKLEATGAAAADGFVRISALTEAPGAQPVSLVRLATHAHKIADSQCSVRMMHNMKITEALVAEHTIFSERIRSNRTRAAQPHHAGGGARQWPASSRGCWQATPRRKPTWPIWPWIISWNTMAS